MLNALCFFIGLLGAGLLSFGAWLLMPALGFITGGMLCLMWSWLMSRAIANVTAQPKAP